MLLHYVYGVNIYEKKFYQSYDLIIVHYCVSIMADLDLAYLC
jgi:hypothetical protein